MQTVNEFALQRLKGGGLWLRRFGFEGEHGLAEESGDEIRPVLDPPEHPRRGRPQRVAQRAAARRDARTVTHDRNGPVSEGRPPRWPGPANHPRRACERAAAAAHAAIETFKLAAEEHTS